MADQKMVHGLPEIKEENQLCDSCLVGKQTRHSFPIATPYRSAKALELLHADLCGPISPATPAHNRYIFVIIDDCTRYMWTILLKEKSEAFDKFKDFKSLVEKEVNKQSERSVQTEEGSSHQGSFRSFVTEVESSVI